ncbi:hypothetical protein E4U47_000640 [Claviceps purpurea]|nr:hypothetical protein E4U47_000640 [Claviceps purpurea]
MREGLRFSEARRPESDRIAEQVSPWIEEDWPTGQDTISDTPGEEPWENKIFTCLVISPAGHDLGKFSTIMELLEAEPRAGAIKAHRSHFLQSNILRRSIGPKNILITDPANTNGFKGILLDLDCAKWRDSKLDEADAQLRIGTPHVARCAPWLWRSMISGKTDHMTIEGLEELMEEFPMALNVVKPRCRKIRGILFYLDQDGRMTFGTPSGDPDRLYGPIIAAFDETISTL